MLILFHRQLVIWLGVFLASCAVCLRAFLRIKYNGRFQLDDIFTGFAHIILITSAIIYTFLIDPLCGWRDVAYGLKPPSQTFKPNVEIFRKLEFAVILCFWTCLWTVKASFLAFFYPLSNGLRTDRILWYCVTGFIVLGYIASVISYPIACHEFGYGLSRPIIPILPSVLFPPSTIAPHLPTT